VVAAAIRNRAASRPSREGDGHHGHADVAARGDGLVDAAVELALDAVGLAPHPEDHPGQHDHGQQRHGGEGEQPGPAGEVLDRQVDDHPRADRHRRRRRDPLPHRADQVAAADPPDVGVDDGHHQGGLEALTEHDQQRGQHGMALQRPGSRVSQA
jgi:hypothetical protein